MFRELGDTFRDVRYSVRALAKAPAFTFLCTAVLALGIGINTAMFSFIGSVIFRNITAKKTGELVVVAGKPDGVSHFVDFSYPDFLDFRNQSGKAFSDMLAYDVSFSGLAVNGHAHDVLTLYVSDNFFTMLGVHAQAGQVIEPQKEVSPTSPNPVVVLSHSYWQNTLFGDPSVIGKAALLDGFSVTIIGVAQKDFKGPNAFYSPNVYVPLNQLAIEKKCACAVVRGPGDLRVIGELRPGVSRGEATALINVIAKRSAQQYPETKGITYEVVPEALANPQPDAAAYWPIVASFVMGLAVIVLLLAGTNVTNLLFVRTTARQGQMGIRLALGASRWKMVRQSVAENLILAFLGGALGTLLGIGLSKYLSLIARPVDFPMFQLEIHPDWHVFVFTLAITLLVGIGMGIISARIGWRSQVNLALHEGRTLTPSRRMNRIRSILVVAQIAASTVLLVAAGLFLEALQTVQKVDPGFEARNVVNFTLDLKDPGYEPMQTNQFYGNLLKRVRAFPGVESAAYASSVPFASGYRSSPVLVEARPLDANQQVPTAIQNDISPDYFAVMKLPILKGRAFLNSDVETSPKVGIINEEMAQRFWPNQDPLGKRFKSTLAAPWIEVVGVSKNVNYLNPMSSMRPYYYVPFLQTASLDLKRNLQIRSTISSEALTPDILRLIRSLAPDVPVASILTMDQQLQGLNGMYLFHVNMNISAVFGVLGLLLAIVGIYGVVSATTSSRAREIAVRMALGADRRSILKLFLRQGLILIAIGEGLGILLMIPVARLLGSVLPYVAANNVVVFAVMALFIASSALLASYLPSRRATHFDPAVLLRGD